ncbi:SusC/RagA family TonB-linked outer membrane protein [Marinilabilia salmonicolor]|uniref:SusC/RagA family TonB-linked outer membrane protein n=1 Tax=Marinilabilia salmonicolor TaxID=989 RepID=UPI00138A1D9B|nr:STN domain-containing protein [Marinilabilia salmonicolor]
MKVVVILMIIGVTQVFASSIYGQEKKLSLKIEDSSLETIFKKIENESDFHFFYRSEDLTFDKTFDINVERGTIFQILNIVLSEVDLSYKVFDKYIAISPVKSTQLPGIQDDKQKVISGVVVDAEGESIPGVTVTVKGSTTGTITDMSGVFELSIPVDSDVLVFSFIGMKSQEVVLGNQTRLEVTMEEEIMGLDEVVVVGYGTQKKKLITGATSQVNTEELTRQNTVSAIDALKSNTAGMQIVKTSGQPGSGYRINIRGLGTTGDASPLFIVDGIPVGDIDFLNPSDIESIDVLKDAASAAIYGSRSANGVVLVTTKSGKFESKPTITYDGYYGVQNF